MVRILIVDAREERLNVRMTVLSKTVCLREWYNANLGRAIDYSLDGH